MQSVRNATLIFLGLLSANITVNSMLAVWVLPSVLDESYISRETYVSLCSVSLGLALLSAVGSMIVQSHFVSTRNVLVERYMVYYLTSIVLGMVEVLLVSVFMRQTRNVDTLNTSTFTHTDNFKSIFVYRDLFLVTLAFWAVRLLAYLTVSLEIIQRIPAARPGAAPPSMLGAAYKSRGRSRRYQ